MNVSDETLIPRAGSLLDLSLRPDFPKRPLHDEVVNASSRLAFNGLIDSRLPAERPQYILHFQRWSVDPRPQDRCRLKVVSEVETRNEAVDVDAFRQQTLRPHRTRPTRLHPHCFVPRYVLEKVFAEISWS